MAAELGLTTDIRPRPLAEFMGSDEIVISSSGGGVIALTRVDDRIFGNGAAGPVATALHETYWDWMARPEMRTEIPYPATDQA